jgi:hypothetical protein
MLGSLLCDPCDHWRMPPIRTDPPPAGVYFVKWGDFIKVGQAENVVTRRRALECSLPHGAVEPLGWISCPHNSSGHRDWSREYTEGRFHRALRRFRARGEWFHDVPPVRRLLAKYMQPWPDWKPWPHAHERAWHYDGD